MDVLALVVASAGLIAAADGHTIIGGTLYILPLVSLPIAIAVERTRHQRVPTLLPLTFKSYIVSVVVAFVVGLGLRSWSELPFVAGLGLSIYYLVCVSLDNRAVRYGRLGTGTAHVKNQPIMYWFWVTLYACVAALFLGLLLTAVITKRL
jgi:hypothetical protein